MIPEAGVILGFAISVTEQAGGAVTAAAHSTPKAVEAAGQASRALGMTAGGWTMMIVSWTAIFLLAAFCFSRIFRDRAK